MKPRPPLPAGPYLIVGLARSGIAAGLALRERGERVIGVDAGAAASAQALADAGVELHLEEDGSTLLDRAGAVVKSPGVPRQAPVIAHARARGLPVLGELELGWRLLANEMIAVTGTNGKTTTVELIGHIHRAAGLPVAVAGNVGTALSGLVGQVDGNVTIVCEVSSFQLEDTLAFAPEAAVLLNIAPDHLDRHETFESYRDAKLQIFACQGTDDIAVVPAGFELPLALRGHGRLVSFGGELSDLEMPELRLRGQHNVQNALAAAAVCLARGLEGETVREGLRTFAGVAHRLEEVARRGGALYVNDSKATNVASTLVALDAFPEGTIHLILGGQGKGQDFSALRGPVSTRCRAAYLIGEDAGVIATALDGAGVPVHECAVLDRALARATEAAVEGDVVLLSPACASFDQFADFEARGRHFRELVMAAA
jgi:UDP-N-acetylmuramoylalanine--D-glutamate ligase